MEATALLLLPSVMTALPRKPWSLARGAETARSTEKIFLQIPRIPDKIIPRVDSRCRQEPYRRKGQSQSAPRFRACCQRCATSTFFPSSLCARPTTPFSPLLLLCRPLQQQRRRFRRRCCALWTSRFRRQFLLRGPSKHRRRRRQQRVLLFLRLFLGSRRRKIRQRQQPLQRGRRCLRWRRRRGSSSIHKCHRSPCLLKICCGGPLRQKWPTNQLLPLLLLPTSAVNRKWQSTGGARPACPRASSTATSAANGTRPSGARALPAQQHSATRADCSGPRRPRLPRTL